MVVLTRLLSGCGVSVKFEVVEFLVVTDVPQSFLLMEEQGCAAPVPYFNLKSKAVRLYSESY